jgi:hypothetical protein
MIKFLNRVQQIAEFQQRKTQSPSSTAVHEFPSYRCTGGIICLHFPSLSLMKLDFVSIQ